MDVVKTNIKKLNGLIEIKSEKGQGSEFILRLPLTLAIIQSLLVEVEGEVYSIPLSSVLETLRVDQRQFHLVGGQEVLKLRESVLPLIRLEQVFKVQPRSERGDFCYVVVIGAADKRVGLVVSRWWVSRRWLSSHWATIWPTFRGLPAPPSWVTAG